MSDTLLNRIQTLPRSQWTRDDYEFALLCAVAEAERLRRAASSGFIRQRLGDPR